MHLRNLKGYRNKIQPKVYKEYFPSPFLIFWLIAAFSARLPQPCFIPLSPERRLLRHPASEPPSEHATPLPKLSSGHAHALHLTTPTPPRPQIRVLGSRLPPLSPPGAAASYTANPAGPDGNVFLAVLFYAIYVNSFSYCTEPKHTAKPTFFSGK